MYALFLLEIGSIFRKRRHIDIKDF